MSEESFIEVPTTGKDLETLEFNNGNGKRVHREGVFIGDAEDGSKKVNVAQDADGTNGRLNTNAYITDRLGRHAKISQKGELLVGSNIDDVNVNFQYAIRTANTVTTETGTGDVSHPGVNGSYAQLSPGTGVGRAEVVSKQPIRYRGGHESYCELSWIFRTPEINLTQGCGYVNDDNVWAFGYEDLIFGLWYIEGGNPTFITQSDFNHDKLDGSGPSGYTLDPQSINVYRNSFVWHGGLDLVSEIQVGQEWWPVHTLSFANAIDETHLENPHLPCGGWVERLSGTGTDEDARTGSWRGGSIAGSAVEQSDDWTAWTVLEGTVTNGQRNNLFTIRNVSTWQGKTNHVVYELGVVTFDSELTKSSAVYGVKGATISGGGTPTYIDEGNHPLQYIEGGTLSGGARGPATVIKRLGDRRTDVRGTGIFVFPGEDFAFEVEPGSTGEFSISARLRALQ